MSASNETTLPSEATARKSPERTQSGALSARPAAGRGARTRTRAPSPSSARSASIDASRRLAPDLDAARGTDDGPRRGEEEAEDVVDLRRRPHRGAGRARGRLLLDGERRQEVVDPVDVGPLHPLEELARVRRHRLDEAPLPLRVERVEGERRLPRARGPGDDGDRADRDAAGDALEVVRPRARHLDGSRGLRASSARQDDQLVQARRGSARRSSASSPADRAARSSAARSRSVSCSSSACRDRRPRRAPASSGSRPSGWGVVARTRPPGARRAAARESARPGDGRCSRIASIRITSYGAPATTSAGGSSESTSQAAKAASGCRGASRRGRGGCGHTRRTTGNGRADRSGRSPGRGAGPPGRRAAAPRPAGRAGHAASGGRSRGRGVSRSRRRRRNGPSVLGPRLPSRRSPHDIRPVRATGTQRRRADPARRAIITPS